MNVLIDANKFSSSNGALLALYVHAELLRSAGYRVVWMCDPKTAEILEASGEVENDVICQSNFISFIFLAKLIFTYDVDKVYIPHCISFVKNLPVLLFKDTIYWVQGLLSEEMKLKGDSKLMCFIAKLSEKIAYKLSDHTVVVSEAMGNVLEKDYGKAKRLSIVPCLPRTSSINAKKIKNSFCYIGGMSKWQKVDSIIDVFLDIRSTINDAKLTIVTKDIPDAQKILEDKGCSQDFVSLISIDNKDDMNIFLSSQEYGFLLRDNTLLNNVASPIKFAEYISCGVNVIISEGVGDFSNIVKKHSVGMVHNGNSDWGSLNYSLESCQEVHGKYFDKDQYAGVYQC